MIIKDWKFKTKEGLVLDEYTNYPEDIKQLVPELELPDNALSHAKISIFQENLQGVVFHLGEVELPIPTDKILTFNPFVRTICDGMSGSSGNNQDYFYLLDGEEFPLKKNLTKQKDLKILHHLRKLNIQ